MLIYSSKKCICSPIHGANTRTQTRLYRCIDWSVCNTILIWTWMYTPYTWTHNDIHEYTCTYIHRWTSIHRCTYIQNETRCSLTGYISSLLLDTHTHRCTYIHRCIHVHTDIMLTNWVSLPHYRDALFTIEMVSSL